MRNFVCSISFFVFRMRQGILPSSFYISDVCGNVVHNARVSTGKLVCLMHSTADKAVDSVHKYIDFALSFTQDESFLYTVFQHINNTFTSVNTRVVHTIHRAYKDIHEVNKRIYI